MNTSTQSTQAYIADALVFVHGELAPVEARRQLALNIKSGDQRNADLWQRVVDVIVEPSGQHRPY